MSEPLEINLDLDKLFQPAWATSPTDPNKYARYDGTEGESRGDRRLVVLAPVATVAPGHRVAQAATADLALKGVLMALRASLGIPRADLGATVLAVAPVVQISVRNP
jgi:hypothetical protein